MNEAIERIRDQLKARGLDPAADPSPEEFERIAPWLAQELAATEREQAERLELGLPPLVVWSDLSTGSPELIAQKRLIAAERFRDWAAAEATKASYRRDGPGPAVARDGFRWVEFAWCPGCGRPFERARSKQVYHSKECANRARVRKWRDQHPGLEAERRRARARAAGD